MKDPHRITDERPWGRFEQFTLNEPSTVKILYVKSGETLSLQKHAHRREHWYVIEGSGSITLGDVIRELSPGDECDIPEGTLHRLSGTGESGIVVLEIAYGTFEEGDIERVDDKYGR
jgi:mannose-6-phosphate isomerase-like protein (cupin superfamily)